MNWQKVCVETGKIGFMKRKVCCILFFIFHLHNTHAQSNVRIQAGINLANISNSKNLMLDKAHMVSTVQVGLIGDMYIGNSFYLQSGVLYTGKGAKVQRGEEGTDGYFSQTFNPKYLEVPLNLLLKLSLGVENKLFVGAGPYLSAGVGGKFKTEGQDEQKINFINTTTTATETGFGDVNRFDYGLNGIAGIEGKSIVVGIHYGYGLAKLQSAQDYKNRVLSLTLGLKL